MESKHNSTNHVRDEKERNGKRDRESKQGKRKIATEAWAQFAQNEFVPELLVLISGLKILLQQWEREKTKWGKWRKQIDPGKQANVSKIDLIIDDMFTIEARENRML